MYCTKFYPISECKDLSVYNTILKCKKKCGDFKNKCNSRWKNVLDVNKKVFGRPNKFLDVQKKFLDVQKLKKKLDVQKKFWTFQKFV